jgi:hypothetical protein
LRIRIKMSSHDAKVLQHLVLNFASSVETGAFNIRSFLEEAFRHLGDEHYLLNALLAIRKEVDLMEQDALESKARSDPEKERMEEQINLAEPVKPVPRQITFTPPPSSPELYEASDNDSYDSDRSTRYSIWNL